jgi:PAS domain-containing protein
VTRSLPAPQVALRPAGAREAATARRMQAVLRGTYDAYVSIERCGRVVAWNASAERIRLPAAEAVHHRITDLIFRSGSGRATSPPSRGWPTAASPGAPCG